MELRPGYKQTEVGVIPEDWDSVLVGDLFTFKNGLNKAKRYFGHGTPIVNYMDVFGRSSLRAEEVRGRVEVSKAELNAYEVCKGDVFFTRTSETVDEIGIASLMLDEAKDTVFSGFVLRARPTFDALVDEFKSYCFSPRYFRKQVTARASYTTRALINGRSLSAALLAKPPKAEQFAIATALSDVDALLAAQDALIAKKRAIKQGAMPDLLTGKRRLPGFSGEWEVKRLDSVLRFQVGFPFSSLHFNGAGNGIRLVKNRDLKADDQLIHYAGVYEPGFVVKSGDVLIGMDGDFLPCLWARGEALLNQRVGRIVPSKKLDVIYAYYRLVEPLKKIEQITSSTTVKHLSHGDVEGIEVPLPEIDEQVAIAEVLSEMDAEISVLEAQRAKTAQIKQGMMQVLLTGQVRLV